jgi:hypothetical protein
MGRYYRDRQPLLKCRRCSRRLIAPLKFDVASIRAMCPDCSMNEPDDLFPVFDLAAVAA